MHAGMQMHTNAGQTCFWLLWSGLTVALPAMPIKLQVLVGRIFRPCTLYSAV